MVRLFWLNAAAALFIAAGGPLHAQTALPPGEGRDIVAVACTQCHALNPLTASRDGPVGWKRHVYNMVLRGAQLTPREADTVIAYLVTNFGPGQPLVSAKPVALANGAGKELVETRCTVCHDLERVTAVKRDKKDWETIVTNMFERWGTSAPDETRTITAYLSERYGAD